jgi:hypothetical protein
MTSSPTCRRGPFGRFAAADAGIRVHLMGHSFGARLVAYSLSGLPQSAAGANSPVTTLLLIQGAFSTSRSRTRFPTSWSAARARCRRLPATSTARCWPRSAPRTALAAGGTRPPACWPTKDAESAVGHQPDQPGPPSRSSHRELDTTSSRVPSICSTPTPSSAPISRPSAAPTATSGMPRRSGRSSTPPAWQLRG